LNIYKKKIFISCTEQSGENICYNILKNIDYKNYIIDGISGKNSQKFFRKKYFDISLFKSIGFVEIIFSIFKFVKIIDFVSNEIRINQYDIIICIDSPDFNYNLVKKIRKSGFNKKIIQIVAPTVWAWRPNRAKKFAKLYDEIFTLFEFEKKYFENYGLKTTFIGHPIYHIKKNYNDNKIKKNYISFLMGSRENEIKKLFKYFEVIYNYINSNKNLDFIIFIPTLPHLESLIKNKTKNWNVKTIISTNNDLNDKYYQRVFMSITCSGTASLEISKRLIPQIIIYKLNILTEFIFSFLVKVKYANLLNIIKNEMIIQELVNHKLTRTKLLNTFKYFLFNKTVRSKQLSKIQKTIQLIDTGIDPYKIITNRLKKII
tara:strand:+ start:11275 stop:12396 length:1122 start_codon:yes stop_codon:yes gene_type:complete